MTAEPFDPWHPIDPATGRERDDARDDHLSRSAWDDDFYEQLRESVALDAAQDHADRWMEAWDRLAPLGIVGPEDRDLPLRELERLAGMLGSS